MTTITRKDLNVADLKVGDEVVMYSPRRGAQPRSTHIVRITKTTLALENGRVFNVATDASRFTPTGQVGYERKSAANRWPSDRDRTMLFLPNDPWVQTMLDYYRNLEDAEHRRSQEQSILAHGVHSGSTVEQMEAAIAVLQDRIKQKQEN